MAFQTGYGKDFGKDGYHRAFDKGRVVCALFMSILRSSVSSLCKVVELNRVRHLVLLDHGSLPVACSLPLSPDCLFLRRQEGRQLGQGSKIFGTQCGCHLEFSFRANPSLYSCLGCS